MPQLFAAWFIHCVFSAVVFNIENTCEKKLTGSKIRNRGGVVDFNTSTFCRLVYSLCFVLRLFLA